MPQGTYPPQQYVPAVHTDCAAPSGSWAGNMPTQANNHGMFNDNRGKRGNSRGNRRRQKVK